MNTKGKTVSNIMAKTGKSAQIFELMRRYNRKSRVIASAFQTGLTLTESHILIELDSQPLKGVGDLCAALRLDKSTLSRSVKGLITRSILKELPLAGDQRRKS